VCYRGRTMAPNVLAPALTPLPSMWSTGLAHARESG